MTPLLLRARPVLLACLLALGALSGCMPLPARSPGGQPSLDLRALERQVHELVNRERRAQGLAPLAWNSELGAIARAHSQDMAAHDYFAHIDLRGHTPSQRAARAGFECVRTSGRTWVAGIAENLYATAVWHRVRTHRTAGGAVSRTYEWKTQAELAAEAVQGWMESPGHRANLLATTPEAEGIGVALAGETLYFTQNLC